MGTLHLAVNVFVLLKDSEPLKDKTRFFYFRFRIISGHTSLYHAGIFNFGLERLTPLCQAMLGTHCSAMLHAARQLLTTARRFIMVVGP